MSHRLVKKVLNQQPLPKQDEDHLNVEEEEEEDEDDHSANRSSINPFDLLNDHDSDHAEDQVSLFVSPKKRKKERKKNCSFLDWIEALLLANWVLFLIVLLSMKGLGLD